MKKSRYSDEQIVRILREADKGPIAEVAKRHGVSEQSIYSWRKRFGEMNADDVNGPAPFQSDIVPFVTHRGSVANFQ
jgi:transposase-like protein